MFTSSYWKIDQQLENIGFMYTPFFVFWQCFSVLLSFVTVSLNFRILMT